MSRVVEVSELTDSISCAVCMDPFSSACIAPCGHSFCRECAEECVNLKHECPLCKAPVEASSLVRNIALQALVDNIMHSSTEYDRRYFSSLQMKAVGALEDVDPEMRQYFSPIELCFARTMQSSFVVYQDFFRRLKHTFDQDMRQAQLMEGPRRSEATAAAQHRFDTSVTLLVQDCEQYLAQTVVPPLLLGCTLTVTCPPRNMHFNMQVDAVTTKAAVLNAMKLHFDSKGPGQQMLRFNEPVLLYLRRHDDVYGDSKVFIDTDDMPIGGFVQVGRLDAGWKIVLESDVELQSDTPPPCFVQAFGTPEQPARVDYYSCIDCGLNWVCSSCADVCHKNHSLRPHVMQHTPTWACCYCFKKHTKSHCKFVGGATTRSLSNSNEATTCT